jgi:hypothetical protein
VLGCEGSCTSALTPCVADSFAFLLLYQYLILVVLVPKFTSCPHDGSCNLLTSCRATASYVPLQCFVGERTLVQ